MGRGQYDFSREPCPWRIVGDCGGAFTLGILGGSLFSFVLSLLSARALLFFKYFDVLILDGEVIMLWMAHCFANFFGFFSFSVKGLSVMH